MEHLNGFELAGKDMKVGHVTEQHANNSLEQDDERAGFDLGATGRLALMAKLAEGTGMKVPESARAALYGVQEPAAPKVSVNLLFLNQVKPKEGLCLDALIINV